MLGNEYGRTLLFYQKREILAVMHIAKSRLFETKMHCSAAAFATSAWEMSIFLSCTDLFELQHYSHSDLLVHLMSFFVICTIYMYINGGAKCSWGRSKLSNFNK